jgi:nickel-dependent lactate racemase
MTDMPIPWGQDEMTISLPAHWTLQQVARPEIRPASVDWPDRMSAVLAQPGTGLSLEKLLAARPGGKIVIIIEDVTRHSPVAEILAVLMREIRHADVKDSQVSVVFATGMHPDMTDQQAQEKLGDEAARLAWRSNPWKDKAAYVNLGSVEKTPICIDRGVVDADLRIIVSSVSPHLQAGFGGGYKMLLPGCSTLETIRGLHRQGLDQFATQLVGTGGDRNPMRLMIDAAGELVDKAHGKTFAIQYLLDDNDKPALIAAGEVIATQRMLAKQCAVACGVVINAPADVLITNAYPRDFDLWQSFKGVANTLWAARPGGVVICVTRCPAGANGMKSPPWPLNPTWTRRIIRTIGASALAGLVMRIVPSLAGDAAFFVRMACQICSRNPIFIVSETLAQEGLKFPGLHLFATIDQAIAAADKMLGKKPQRVTVFPNGGTTFPTPTITPPRDADDA